MFAAGVASRSVLQHSDLHAVLPRSDANSDAEGVYRRPLSAHRLNKCLFHAT